MHGDNALPPHDDEPPAHTPEVTRRALIAGALAAGVSTTALGGSLAADASAAQPRFVVNHKFPAGKAPTNPLTLRMIDDPAVAWHVDSDAIVAAVNDELLVRGSAVAQLGSALTNIAFFAASLQASVQTSFTEDAQSLPTPPQSELASLEDTQLWRIRKPTANSPFAEAKKLNKLVGPSDPPAVSPNHVFDACHSFDSCPGGPPTPVPSLGAKFIPPAAAPVVDVVVIDTGYIPSATATDPPDHPHAVLDTRVIAAPGYFLDSSASPAAWTLCPPDDPLAVPDHPTTLDGVAGHGTFIAGLIASRCPQARLTMVGERRAVTGVSSSPTVYSDEFAVARSLLRYCTADVVSLGFAFPTFGDVASIPFSLIMDWLVVTGRQVAVVAPAGNENSARSFWPAADKHVVGVGATDSSQSSRAQFLIRDDGFVQSGSNWGTWLDCAARGESVSSLFIDWVGTTEDEPASEGSLTFTGWATWSGTSFSAPKVTAAIAQAIAAGTPALEAFDRVATTRAGTPVSTPAIPGSRRVPLTNLLLG
jgi:hypothetical protein